MAARPGALQQVAEPELREDDITVSGAPTPYHAAESPEGVVHAPPALISECGRRNGLADLSRSPNAPVSADPLGGLTPADDPLIQAENLSEQPGPLHLTHQI
jgi:hypothetical protein